VTSGRVCRLPETEVPMGKLNLAAVAAVRWLKKRSFLIVVLLSAFHIGLAYIHARESG